MKKRGRRKTGFRVQRAEGKGRRGEWDRDRGRPVGMDGFTDSRELAYGTSQAAGES